MSNISEYTIKEFEMYHPSYVKDVVGYYNGDPFELIVKLKNGELLSYYSPEKTVQVIPREGEYDEKIMRREFGTRLQRRLSQVCMLQSTLAEVTGIPRTQLSNYMNGKALPSYTNLVKIAKALNCSLDYFQVFRKF